MVHVQNLIVMHCHMYMQCSTIQYGNTGSIIYNREDHPIIIMQVEFSPGDFHCLAGFHSVTQTHQSMPHCQCLILHSHNIIIKVGL